MARIMQGGDGLQNGRAEGFYARGIRSIPGLFTTPYSPLRPHARAARHLCEIHSQHHQTAHTTPEQADRRDDDSDQPDGHNRTRPEGRRYSRRGL
ncbi:hypothetical protein D1159_00220 [Pseudoflavonifractor sp. 524-17]|nr:hypothetical protein [Pseudoflavonifractor sp. 524-17]